MKEKQRIQIGTRNWNDIIKLPCFMALTRNDVVGFRLLVRGSYLNGESVRLEDEWYGICAYPGDRLVEYDNGKWGVERGKGTSE